MALLTKVKPKQGICMVDRKRLHLSKFKTSQMKRLALPFPLLFVCMSLLPSLAAQQTTLHLITSIDYINDDIAEGCRKDGEKAVELFGAVAQDAGLAFQHHPLQFERFVVEEFLQYFECGPDDVVVFFYSGHGTRYEEDGSEWPWPYLYYCQRGAGEDPEACELDMDVVEQILVEKGPRMTIVLGDSCNDVQDSEDANEYLKEAADFRDDPDPDAAESFANLELITLFQGQIIASASSPGQTSNTNSDHGSYFANEFFHFLFEALTGQSATSWEEILTRTKEKVRQVSPGQIPQFCVNGNCG